MVIKTMMIIYHFVVVDPDLELEILFWKRGGNKGVLIFQNKGSCIKGLKKFHADSVWFCILFFTNKARNIIAFTSISGLDLPGFGVQN